MSTAHESVLKMLCSLDIKNGPAMLQGFFDDGIFRFYDPGLRFPGVDFDRVYKVEYGIDVMKAMVTFSLTGHMPEIHIDERNLYLDGRKAAVLFPTIGAGEIAIINGLTEIENLPNVYSVLPRYMAGEKVEWCFNVKQRLAEIDVLAEDQDKLKQLIMRIQDMIQVLDVNGESMIYGSLEFHAL